MPATDIIGLPIRSYDDEGMMVYAPFQAGVTRLCLPILDLSKLSNPALKIYVYYMDSTSKFSVVASHDSGNTWQEVAAAADNSIHNRWHMASFDLSALKGETDARIALQATSSAQGLYVCMDKFVIEDNLANDLMLTDMALPSKIQAGKSFVVSVNAVNNGYEPTGDYEVEFTVNGVSAKSVTGTGLAPSAFREIKVELPLSANSSGLTLEVNARYSADENPANNKLTGTTEVLRSRFPQPTGLTNESEGSEVADLTWEAPQTSYNATITDNLESYEPGSIGGIEVIGNLATNTIEVKNAIGQIGDYKLIDNDSLMTSYVYGVVGYGLPYLGQGMVCQVFDMERYPVQSSIWAAHSGNRMFCFWQALDPTLESATAVANDDYLILPELSEDDSRISFWAKSLTSKYNLASFEIMVSFTGTDVEDFYPFQSVKDVPAEYAAAAESGYTFYEFDLPEGTKYAAIRHNSFDSMAMLVDDITFTPANNQQELTLLGYNVYRNDVKLNDTPVSECQFHDAPAEKGDYTYNVSAVFAEGESRYSNSVELKVLSGIGAAAAHSGRIYTAGRSIIVEGHEGQTVEVFTTDGRKIASVTAKTVTSIAAENGIYIVKTGSDAVAVAVK